MKRCNHNLQFTPKSNANINSILKYYIHAGEHPATATTISYQFHYIKLLYCQPILYDVKFSNFNINGNRIWLAGWYYDNFPLGSIAESYDFILNSVIDRVIWFLKSAFIAKCGCSSNFVVRWWFQPTRFSLQKRHNMCVCGLFQLVT